MRQACTNIVIACSTMRAASEGACKQHVPYYYSRLKSFPSFLPVPPFACSAPCPKPPQPPYAPRRTAISAAAGRAKEGTSAMGPVAARR